MFLSFFLIFIFLIFAISEIYFLGKYFSISQEAFLNKKLSIISVGFIFYIFITFIFVIPFYFFKVSSGYINISLAIKDILIGVFLLSRRESFKNNKFHIYVHLSIFIAGILIAVFYKFLGSHTFELKTISKEGNNYFWITKINDYINFLTFSKGSRVMNFYLWPLLAMGVFSFIGSFYSIFFKSNIYFNFLISFITSLVLISVFSTGYSLEILFSSILLLFLLHIGVNIITFSRRRYSMLYGIASISAWSINPYLFIPILALTLTIVITYSILRRPRPSLFAIQLISPLILISTFWIRDYSRALAIFLIIFILFIYISIFYFARFRVIESNKYINMLNYIVPILIFLILFIYSIVTLIIDDDISIKNVLSIVNFIYIFDNTSANILIYILYFSIATTTIGITFFSFLKKKRMIGINLILLITSLVFIMFYNPLIAEALLYMGINKIYLEHLSFISVVPVLIIFVIWLIIKFKYFISKYKLGLIPFTQLIKGLSFGRAKGK